ncbi:ferredoxin reductase-like protein [Pleomassaria siparia CBS 279.74]|uniref:nitric oxide dioxygenase n=1 Tax=Pleomassaria siparia CBS 279.74 TaxID=1314801 RepID=A0A6G1KE09_9PLEO|nr:ferredoxin reductase-like protein [Pleomassaria siparia CBS 279.74]
MALTYKESLLVKATIPFLRENGEMISDIVYTSLLKKVPALNNTLNLVHLKDKTLARALTVVILHFASNLSNICELIPRLERVCQKHYYEILGPLIVDTFADVMGPDMTSDTKAAWAKAYKMLSGMLIGREKHIYKAFDGDRWNDWRKFRIERKDVEANDMYSFKLVPLDGRVLPSFLPGQYISVRMFVPEVEYLQTRQYSLSDMPNVDSYRITLKRDIGNPKLGHAPGLISNILSTLKVGDEIECSHPSGDFYLDTTAPSGVPLVLISAGRGIAPLLSMLTTALHARSNRPITWIHGCRDQLPFGTHLTYLKRRYPNLHSIVFMTTASRFSAGQQELRYDFNQRVDLTKVSPPLLYTQNGSTEYYICGPETFMQRAVKQLLVMGVSVDKIKCQMFRVSKFAQRMK